MEMYRTLAPCTVDGEGLSWCLADGLTWSQLALNILWCWECSDPMLIGWFWWNKDKPSPQKAQGAAPAGTTGLTPWLQGLMLTPWTCPQTSPYVCGHLPQLLAGRAVVPILQIESWWAVPLIAAHSCVFERAGVVPQPTSPTLYQTGCSLPCSSLQRVMQVYPVACCQDRRGSFCRQYHCIVTPGWQGDIHKALFGPLSKIMPLGNCETRSHLD